MFNDVCFFEIPAFLHEARQGSEIEAQHVRGKGAFQDRLVFRCGHRGQNAFHFHPLVNTSTLVISRKNIQRFIQATGHEVQIVDVPGQD